MLYWRHNTGGYAGKEQMMGKKWKQWGLVKPDEVLKPVVPETDTVIF